MLRSLFDPGSIAVIGVSRQPGKVGHDIFRNLVESGFSGQVIGVNHRGGQVLGHTLYRSLDDYAGPVDQVVVALPANKVMEAARAAANHRAGALVVVASGFKEKGAAGHRLEQELVDFCRSNNIRLLGPNCLGHINTSNHLNAAFAGSMPRQGTMAIFSQSGAVLTSMLDISFSRHLGLARMVSIGNKADISEVELLKVFAADPEISAIMGYLEDISSGDEFVKAAEEASNLKPVVILKAGTTPAGQRAAACHTGVVQGSETAYGAAFRRAGVCRADSFEALFDYAAALSMQPMPAGDRVMIITNAGGPGTMAADAVEKAGLAVASLQTDQAALLGERLPEAASLANPIDVLGDAGPERYVAAMEAALADPGVDAVLVILTPQGMTRPAEIARAVAARLDGSKPVLAVFLGGREVMPGRQELAAAGLPDFETPARAVAALRAMYDYGTWRRRPARHLVRFPVNRRRVERIIARRQRTGQPQLGEVKSKDILRAYGFRTLEGRITSSPEEAVEIARFIGFPVAMKIVSPNIVHKTDMGGVRLNLDSAEAVADAFELMMLKIGKNAPQALIEGIYVERMAERGLEVIIGMTRDHQFGPMLMFGLGGIFVEVMKDVTFHLAPITEDEAIQMLKSTRSWAMLQGRRGSKELDIGALAASLQRISQLTTDFPQILELDINPLIVGEIGQDPVVADARMTLSGVL